MPLSRGSRRVRDEQTCAQCGKTYDEGQHHYGGAVVEDGDSLRWMIDDGYHEFEGQDG